MFFERILIREHVQAAVLVQLYGLWRVTAHNFFKLLIVLIEYVLQSLLVQFLINLDFVVHGAAIFKEANIFGD